MTFTTSAGATRFIRHGHACLGVTGPAGLTLTASGHNNSPLWSRNPAAGAGQLHTWSPWGNGNTADGLPGFNGERPDPVSGSYHLGNGYRAYNPVLRRFNCPDNLSPFGAGGINPYAYCAGDPINHTDPTGHISWQGILGIVGGVIGLGLGLFTAGASIMAAGSLAAAWNATTATAAVAGGLGLVADATGIASGATEDSNPAASSVLGWVSMATGLAGIVAGVGAGGIRRMERAAAGAPWRTPEGRIGIEMSGRGASVAARRFVQDSSRVRKLQQLSVDTLGGQIPDLAFPSEIINRADVVRRMNRIISMEGKAVDKLQGLSCLYYFREEANLTEGDIHSLYMKLRTIHHQELDSAVIPSIGRGIETDFAFLPGTGVIEYYRPSPLFPHHPLNRLGLLNITTQYKVPRDLTREQKRLLASDFWSRAVG